MNSLESRSESDESVSEPQKVAEFVVPDAQYIRRELPVSEVAVKLGLDVRGRWVRCPQDRAHWARIWLRKNTVKCFSCRCRPMTTIDLAVHVLQADVNQAIQWIAARFDVPKRRRRITRNLRGITRRLYTDYPACKRPRHLELSIDTLRRAPFWAHLTPTARRLAAYLIQATPRESLVLSVTYRELQRSVQTGNRGTLKRAFDQLREIGFVQTSIEATERDVYGRFAGRTVIRLTWGSQQFQSLLSATKYIGSKMNQVKSRDRQEIEPGAMPQKSITSERRLRADLSSVTPFVQALARFGGQSTNVSAILESSIMKARDSEAVAARVLRRSDVSD